MVFSFKERTRSVVNPVTKWSVRNRLANMKTERGQEVVAVKRKPVVPGLPALGVNKADVYSLWWDGRVMDERLIMSEVAGAVTDFRIKGRELFLIARGGLGMFMSNIAEGEFSNSTILYYYNLAPVEEKP